MSSEAAKYSVVRLDSSTDITECKICRETIRSPKCLSCPHTYCLPCLEQYVPSAKPGDQVPCPICRTPFTIPEGGLGNLPDNIFIKRLIDLKLPGSCGEPVDGIPCDLCSSDDAQRAVTRHCIECEQNMCERCSQVHERLAFSQSHRVVTLDSEEGSRAFMKCRPSFCGVHRTKQLELYCKDCTTPICLICRALDHRSHVCSELRQEAQELTEQLEACYPGLDTIHTNKKQEMRDLGNVKKGFIDIVETTKKSIEERCDKLVEVAHHQRDQLLKKLHTFSVERLKIMNTIGDDVERQAVIIENFKRYMEELIKYGSVHDITRSANDMIKRAEELQGGIKKESRIGVVKKDVVSFKPADIEHILSARFPVIGQIETNATGADAFLVNPQIVHISDQGQAIAGIATIESNVYVLRGGTTYVEVCQKDRMHISKQIPVPGMRNQVSLAACPHHSCLYISDHELRCVHRVDLTSKVITKWSVGGQPWGLSVTRNHNLLVTMYNTKQIHEYTTKGGLVRMIKLDHSVDKPLHAVELSTGQLVVSHGWSQTQHRVLVVDAKGRIVSAFGGRRGSTAEQVNGPDCLAVDMYDNILVADYYNNKIQLLSPSMSHLGDIVLAEHQLKEPYRIHLDERNRRLYISEGWRVVEGSGRLFALSNATGDK